MSDLRWDEVKEWFDPAANGSAPDLLVTDTTIDDWQALVTLIRAAGWRAELDCRNRRVEVPASAGDLFVADEEGWLRSLWVWPEPEIEMIFRLWSPDEMISDVSLFELQGQARLDKFCAILSRLGQALDKRVAMYAEGTDERRPPLLAYEVDQDRVVFLAGPWRA